MHHRICSAIPGECCQLITSHNCRRRQSPNGWARLKYGSVVKLVSLALLVMPNVKIAQAESEKFAPYRFNEDASAVLSLEKSVDIFTKNNSILRDERTSIITDDDIKKCVRIGYHLKKSNQPEPKPTITKFINTNGIIIRTEIFLQKTYATLIGFRISQSSTDSQIRNITQNVINDKNIFIRFTVTQGNIVSGESIHFNLKTDTGMDIGKHQLDGPVPDVIGNVGQREWKISTVNIPESTGTLTLGIPNDNKIEFPFIETSQPSYDPLPNNNDASSFLLGVIYPDDELIHRKKSFNFEYIVAGIGLILLFRHK